jgi:hypothetical protein
VRLTGKERVLLWTLSIYNRFLSRKSTLYANTCALLRQRIDRQQIHDQPPGRTLHEDVQEKELFRRARQKEQNPSHAQEMSGEKRPASFGSSQLVKRARPEANGNELATINGSSSGALIQSVSLHVQNTVLCDLQLKLSFQKRKC